MKGRSRACDKFSGTFRLTSSFSDSKDSILKYQLVGQSGIIKYINDSRVKICKYSSERTEAGQVRLIYTHAPGGHLAFKSNLHSLLGAPYLGIDAD